MTPFGSCTQRVGGGSFLAGAVPPGPFQALRASGASGQSYAATPADIWSAREGMQMLNLETPRRPMMMESFPLPEGDPGVAVTVAHMRRLIDHGKKDPFIHELAAKIVQARRVRSFDWYGEARAIYDWTRGLVPVQGYPRGIRFTRDVYGKETLHGAREVVELGIGDCDDFTVLLCSLLGTVGFQTRIVTVAAHPDDPTQFSHVYPEVLINGRWVAVDAARRAPAFGKQPAYTFRRREWETSSEEFVDVQGMSGPAGFGPRALPGAFNPFVPNPAFRGLGAASAISGTRGHGYTSSPPQRNTSYRRHGVRGLGHYGPRAVAALWGLGQDDDDDVESEIGLTEPTSGPASTSYTFYSGGGAYPSILPSGFTPSTSSAASSGSGGSSFPYSTLPADIQAAGTAAAQTILASRASPSNIFPGSIATPFGTISTGSLLLYGGAAVLLVLLLGAGRH